MQENSPQGAGASVEDAPLGLVVRQQEPKNLEGPFGRPDSFLTPTELFYIRIHFPAARLDVASYRLEIEGAVRNPFVLGYEELRRMPSETRVATLESRGTTACSSSRRSSGPSGDSAPSATWNGPGSRLPTCSSEPDWTKALARSSSKAPIAGHPRSRPSRRVPSRTREACHVTRQLRREVLIAYQMNGRDLSEDHGYPVRAIVPGHFGMASVKWLTRIRAVREPFQGYWQTSDYAYWDDVEGQPIRRPLGEIQVKAQIARRGLRHTRPRLALHDRRRGVVGRGRDHGSQRQYRWWRYLVSGGVHRPP